MSSRLVAILVALAATLTVAAPAHADPLRRGDFVWEDAPKGNPAAPGSNVIFLNRCAGGCVVRSGNTDSTTDHSSIGQGTLSAFTGGDAKWNSIVQCMNDVFTPFNVQVTTTDPGTTSHLEIMIAGSPTEIGLGNGTAGIAPFNCSSYMTNALVFAFANLANQTADDICWTAAQEIAHTWALDHVAVSADPLTYDASFQGRRYYQDGNSQCGSDCLYNCSGQPCDAFHQICTNNTKPCYCSGQQTENTYQTVLGLFGAGNDPGPAVAITKPLTGDQVAPGFPVDATATHPSGIISKVELRVDGTLASTLTSAPYAFNAPTTLGNGTHHVEITAYDRVGTAGKAQVDVIIGPPCQKPSDCATNTDTCIGGRCVPGPGVQGGLGMPCTKASDCASGDCASDGTNMYCVDVCTIGQCPSGFGCLTMSGQMSGVCWPGYSDGSGGGCSVGGGGPITLSLVFGLFVLGRRRKSAPANRA